MLTSDICPLGEEAKGWSLGGWAASFALMLTFAVSCSGDTASREYSLPTDLCGAAVPEALYDPIFPPGRELDDSEGFSEDMGVLVPWNCGYDLDGEEIFFTGTAAYSEFSSYLGSQSLDYSMDDAEPVEGEFDAVVWPGFAMAKAPCTIGSDEVSVIDNFMIAVWADRPDDEEESKRVLGELIQPYMGALLDLMPCAEYAGE